MSSTIRVAGTGSTDERLRDLEQSNNYGEVVLSFVVVDEQEGGGGTPGPPGPGVPANGTDGQVLTKTGTADYATAWQTPATGQTLAYRHVQASAATVWSITHNLSFRPNVTAVDSTGRAIWPGALDYVSATAVTLTFSAAVGGEAYLS